MAPEAFDDFVLWATLGIVLGGRLGYVLFYRPDYYVEHPLEALKVWQGGMSFHGGMLGTIVSLALFARLRRVSVLALGDVLALRCPVRPVLRPPRELHQRASCGAA